MCAILTANIELANVTVNTSEPMDTVMPHLRFAVQLLGLAGSFALVKSTRNGSIVVSSLLEAATGVAFSISESSGRSFILSLFRGVSISCVVVDAWLAGLPRGGSSAGMLVSGMVGDSLRKSLPRDGHNVETPGITGVFVYPHLDVDRIIASS